MKRFLLDPSVLFLNQGSFGATPRRVFAAYQSWQRELENQPVEFLDRRAPGLLAAARERVARFLGTTDQNLVFVTNTTTGINMILRSLKLGPGDEVLTTDHEYGALNNSWSYLADQKGFSYRAHQVALPLTSEADFIEQFWAQVTPQTRVIYLSQITSATALIFPVAELCRRARAAGILSVIDGAHVAGQLPVQLDALGADFWSGNLHKWLCCPKGCAVLYARPEVQHLLEPLAIGWGWRGAEPASRLIHLYQDQGTRDISPFLTATAALDFVESSSWRNQQDRGHWLAGEFQKAVVELTGVPPLHPDGKEFYAMMAAAPLPPCQARPLQDFLFQTYRIEIPVFEWNGRQLIRASFFLYNNPEDINQVLEVLPEALDRFRHA
jgi:isopenicillin-N epimerase